MTKEYSILQTTAWACSWDGNIGVFEREELNNALRNCKFLKNYDKEESGDTLRYYIKENSDCFYISVPCTKRLYDEWMKYKSGDRKELVNYTYKDGLYRYTDKKRDKNDIDSGTLDPNDDGFFHDLYAYELLGLPGKEYTEDSIIEFIAEMWLYYKNDRSFKYIEHLILAHFILTEALNYNFDDITYIMAVNVSKNTNKKEKVICNKEFCSLPYDYIRREIEEKMSEKDKKIAKQSAAVLFKQWSKG